MSPAAEPIVAAVDASAGSLAAVEEAVNLAAELEAPLVCRYQQRLTRENERARRVLDRALHHREHRRGRSRSRDSRGSPRQRILEFARDREAQLVVIGSRRRRFGPSVSRAVTRAADRPVVIAAHMPAASPG